MNDTLVALTIGVSAVVTALLRFLPFVFIRVDRETPKIITYFGKYLPYSVMAMLVVYCLRAFSITAYPFGLPELIGVVAVVLLHIWRRNTLISIAGGTALYMLLIRLVF